MNRRLILRMIGELAYPIPLLLGAGTIVWPEAWLLFAIFYLLTAAVWWMLATKDPELLQERMSSPYQKDQPGWDKSLMTVIFLLMLVWLVLMGVDAVRLGWSHVPLPLQVVGLIGIICSSLVIFWTFRENTYLAAVVKIQREHQVVCTGPYARVRHPLYGAVITSFPASSLLLGSWWGLMMSALLALLFAVRTSLEDRKLQDELAGYRDYVARVPYRLFPGIW